MSENFKPCIQISGVIISPSLRLTLFADAGGILMTRRIHHGNHRWQEDREQYVVWTSRGQSSNTHDFSFVLQSLLLPAGQLGVQFYLVKNSLVHCTAHRDAGYRSGTDELIELTYKDLPTKGRDGLNIYKTHTDRVTARSNRSGTNEHIEPTDWLTAKSNKSGTDEHPVKPRCGQFPSGLSHAVSLRLFAEATGASPLPNMVLVSNTS